MARRPTLQEAERAVLDVFRRLETQPGESIVTIGLGSRMYFAPTLREEEIDAALKSLADKKWIELRRAGRCTLTDLGFAQV
jgi:hypothetical protein